jgi:hypothetical protein
LGPPRRPSAAGKTAALLGLLLAAAGVQALGFDAAWHGAWTLGDSRIVVNAQGLQQGSERCTWVKARPERPAGCVAFADLPVTRDQLVRLLDDAEVALKGSGPRKPADGVPNAAALRARLADLQQQRQAVKALGSGEFATVATARAGDGDCAHYLFVDRASLVQVTDCSSRPQAASVKVYKKAA